MPTQRGMQIWICVLFSLPILGIGEPPGNNHLSLPMDGCVFMEELWLAHYTLLPHVCARQIFPLPFPWWVELANSQDKSDRDVWTWTWFPTPCQPDSRHQLLLQLYNVLCNAELLLALRPGFLVLSLHSCLSLTNSLLVPPQGMGGLSLCGHCNPQWCKRPLLCEGRKPWKIGFDFHFLEGGQPSLSAVV